MKNSLFIVGLAVFLGFAFCRNAAADTPNCSDHRFTYFDVKNRVAVSTTPSAPTKILTAVSGPAWVQIRLRWSGSGTLPNGENLLLSNSSTTFSVSFTTGTSGILATNEPNMFDLGCYSGNLYGLIVGSTSAQNAEVFRKR